jgi:hypothetical protein
MVYIHTFRSVTVTYVEALGVIGAKEKAELREAFAQFIVATEKLFGIEDWREVATTRFIIQDDGAFAIQPRINKWSEPERVN